MLSDQTQSEYSYPFSKVDCKDKVSVCSDIDFSISVQLQLCDDEGNCEIELIPYIQPIIKNENDIFLHNIIDQLKDKGYYLKNAIISYYSIVCDSFIFCAVDPVPSYVTIPLQDIESQNLVIRAKLVNENYKQEVKTEEEKKVSQKSARVRIRKIGDVIEKVLQWRKLYSGYVDDNGVLVKMTLMEAANILEIPKKSLDDYLLLLRLGNQYEFDFNLYKNHAVGTLRSFIRKYKAK